MFGTSDRLLDFRKRGFRSVKNIMIPDTSSNHRVNKGCMMFNPDGNFKKIWGMVLIILLLYTATVMPYRMALMSDDESQEWFIVDLCVDMLFMCDIYINLNSPL